LAVAVILVVSKTATVAACGLLPTGMGTASITVNIPANGAYRVWAHLYTPPSGYNGIYLQIPNTTYCQITVGGIKNIAKNTFTWVDYQNANPADKLTVTLQRGTHTINLAGMYPGVGVDKLIFTADMNCVPTGNGSNCESALISKTTHSSVSGLSIISTSGGHKITKTLLISGIVVAVIVASGLWLLLLWHQNRRNHKLRILNNHFASSNSPVGASIAQSDPIVINPDKDIYV